MPVQLPDVNGVYQHLEDRGTTGVPAEFSTSPLRSLDPTTAEWTAVFKINFATPRLEPGPCDRQSDDVEVRSERSGQVIIIEGCRRGLQRPFGLARQSEAHILESCREHFRGLIWGDRLPWAKDDRQWPSSDGDWYPGDQWTTKPGRIRRHDALGARRPEWHDIRGKPTRQMRHAGMKGDRCVARALVGWPRVRPLREDQDIIPGRGHLDRPAETLPSLSMLAQRKETQS